MGIHTKFPIRIVLVTTLNWLIPALCFAQAAPQITAADIYTRAHSSVVVVIGADSNKKPIGQSSGFILAKNRIVINHHVLKGAAEALVARVFFVTAWSHLIAAQSVQRSQRAYAFGWVASIAAAIPGLIGFGSVHRVDLGKLRQYRKGGE